MPEWKFDDDFEIPEKPIPTLKQQAAQRRFAYFSDKFWEMWEEMDDKEKAAYVVGYCAELEATIRQLSSTVSLLQDRLGELEES